MKPWVTQQKSRTAARRRRDVCKVVAFMVLLAVSSFAQARWVFVSPSGSDTNNGLSAATALKTIQNAVKAAYPGDTVMLLPGEYRQDFSTVRDGSSTARILIVGSQESIIRGGGKSHVIDVKHSYIEMRGFVVDGKHGAGTALADYRDKLVFVDGWSRNGVKGLVFHGLSLRNAFGECLRMKGLASRNEIAFNTINTCGLRDYVFGRGGSNGEGIYVGTAPEQLSGKPTDASVENWIHHNVILTKGSECVDLKEGADDNLIEYNVCTGVLYTNGGGISTRSNDNIIQFNRIAENASAGIRMGGDDALNGIRNTVIGNDLYFNRNSGLKIMRGPQGLICGNTIAQPAGSPNVRYGSGVQAVVEASCPEG
ncbi:MAG: hypothetical protein AB7I68_04495 [Porticoccaceae bacterium]